MDNNHEIGLRYLRSIHDIEIKNTLYCKWMDTHSFISCQKIAWEWWYKWWVTLSHF